MPRDVKRCARKRFRGGWCGTRDVLASQENAFEEDAVEQGTYWRQRGGGGDQDKNESWYRFFKGIYSIFSWCLWINLIVFQYLDECRIYSKKKKKGSNYPSPPPRQDQVKLFLKFRENKKKYIYIVMNVCEIRSLSQLITFFSTIELLSYITNDHAFVTMKFLVRLATLWQ